MKKDYEINENIEINENFVIFRLFRNPSFCHPEVTLG